MLPKQQTRDKAGVAGSQLIMRPGLSVMAVDGDRQGSHSQLLMWGGGAGGVAWSQCLSVQPRGQRCAASLGAPGPPLSPLGLDNPRIRTFQAPQSESKDTKAVRKSEL